MRTGILLVLGSALVAGQASVGYADPFGGPTSNGKSTWSWFGRSRSTSTGPSQSLTDNSLTRAIGSGWKKTTGAMTPEPQVESAPDPISLAHRSPPPGPELYVSVAQLREKAGNDSAAIEQYKKALQADPRCLPALLGLAHLYDRKKQPQEAVTCYLQAALHHPKEPAVHNDLGLCYARQGRLPEAESNIRKAVGLNPDNKLYRNNLATVFVQMGRLQDAYAQMEAAHGPAAAHYNLGYLLQQRGDKKAAVAHFGQALAIDPNLTQAGEWLTRLEGRPPVAATPDGAQSEVAAPAANRVEAPIAAAPVAEEAPALDEDLAAMAPPAAAAAPAADLPTADIGPSIPPQIVTTPPWARQGTLARPSTLPTRTLRDITPIPDEGAGAVGVPSAPDLPNIDPDAPYVPQTQESFVDETTSPDLNGQQPAPPKAPVGQPATLKNPAQIVPAVEPRDQAGAPTAAFPIFRPKRGVQMPVAKPAVSKASHNSTPLREPVEVASRPDWTPDSSGSKLTNPAAAPRVDRIRQYQSTNGLQPLPTVD